MKDDEKVVGFPVKESKRMSEKLTSAQAAVADYLNGKCQNLSSRMLLTLLVIFCVIVTALLLRLIISAIN